MLHRKFPEVAHFGKLSKRFLVELNFVNFQAQAENGWQEYWQSQPDQVAAVTAQRKLTGKIEQCDGAKWFLLKQTAYTRGSVIRENFITQSKINILIGPSIDLVF